MPLGEATSGSQPLVDSFHSRSDSLYTVLKVAVLSDPVTDSLKIPTCTALSSKVGSLESSDFFRLEQLWTTVNPQCGSCRCGRCPVTGSIFSFR